MIKQGSIPSILSSSQQVVYLCIDSHGLIVDFNTRFKQLFPFTSKNETPFVSVLPDAHKNEWLQLFNSILFNPSALLNFKIQWLKEKDDFAIYFEMAAATDEAGNVVDIQLLGTLVNMHIDVLQQKQVQFPYKDLSLDDPNKYKLLFYSNPLPLWIYDAETLRFLEVNEAAVYTYGYSRDEFLSMTIEDIRPKEEQTRLKNFHMQNGYFNNVHQGYWLHQKKDGQQIHVEVSAHLLEYEGRKAKLVMATDRTQHILAEEEIVKTNERYSFVSKATFDAIWDWNLETDMIEWNHVVKEMFGYNDMEINDVRWWYKNLHPDDRERVTTNIKNHIKHRHHHWEEEYQFRCADGSYKYIFDRGFTIYDERQKPVRMIGAMQDLTERKRTELTLKQLNTSLEKRAKELAESNAELERFAYVASHDLQEPLRMVSSFLQLIEKRYKDKLDQKAHEYIAFAVDGAERMKGLILDLLEYSRVNTSKEEREPVNINNIIQDLQMIYKNALKETEGVISAPNLPTVHGRKSQIMQLFQNVIGNAIKYKGAEPPVINISYKDDDRFIEFAVADNGIGIEPRFFHKIFVIFQRLHNREQYSGTGIGLAICKKIVDRHGGKIWLTSEPGKGSTFYFTLPK